MHIWDPRSEEHLSNVHPDLDYVISEAGQYIAMYPSKIISSVRLMSEQRKLVADGKSKTLNSRHIFEKPSPNATMKYPRGSFDTRARHYSHAVDLMALDEYSSGTWDPPYYYALAAAVSMAAKKLNVSVVWGGFWQDLREVPSITYGRDSYAASCARQRKKPFLDLGHYELSWAEYPIVRTSA